MKEAGWSPAERPVSAEAETVERPDPDPDHTRPVPDRGGAIDTPAGPRAGADPATHPRTGADPGADAERPADPGGHQHPTVRYADGNGRVTVSILCDHGCRFGLLNAQAGPAAKILALIEQRTRV